MCTLYQVGGSGKRQEASPPAVLQFYLDEFAKEDRKARQLVRPTHLAPVVMPDGRIELMHWGFRVRLKSTTGKLKVKSVVNSREDKLESRTWKQSFEERRCLIPAIAYYEWTGPKGSKQAHLFTRPDQETMWIAGIWEEHPERGRCYSMITTEPNRVAAFVHDRMPAVLRMEEIEPFLAGEMRHFQPADDVLQAEAVDSPLSRSRSGRVPRRKRTPPKTRELDQGLFSFAMSAMNFPQGFDPLAVMEVSYNPAYFGSWEYEAGSVSKLAEIFPNAALLVAAFPESPEVLIARILPEPTLGEVETQQLDNAIKDALPPGRFRGWSFFELNVGEDDRPRWVGFGARLKQDFDQIEEPEPQEWRHDASAEA